MSINKSVMTPSISVRVNVAGMGVGRMLRLVKVGSFCQNTGIICLAETQFNCLWRNEAEHLPTTSALLNDMKLVI
jgi:hypothetical protein